MLITESRSHLRTGKVNFSTKDVMFKQKFFAIECYFMAVIESMVNLVLLSKVLSLFV